MKTITVCIGNSDNKLTQQEWSDFIRNIDAEIEYITYGLNIYAKCYSNTNSCYQNAVFVFGYCGPIDRLKEKIKKIREQFRQDSVALVVGETEFI